MRELKFRAWDKEEQRMYPVFYIEYEPDNGQLAEVAFLPKDRTEMVFRQEPDSYVLMQFTGLRDKNGVEIYEGDIVQWKSKLIGRKGKNDVGFVGWDETHLIYLTLDRNSFTGFFGNSSPMTVIGSIHENPELLSPPAQQSR